MDDRALIFDLDGTLIHSGPEIHAVANEILAVEGFTGLSYDTVQGFIGNGLPTLVARILTHLDQPAEGEQHRRMVTRFHSIYEQRFDLTTIYPGVAEMLTDLSSRHPLALCTNKPEGPTHAVLAHFGLTRFFPVVVGGDTLPQRKPDPAPLREAKRRLGATRAVFVGDSEVDAATAQAAGIPLALFTGGYRKTPAQDLGAAFIFDHHAELGRWLETSAT